MVPEFLRPEITSNSVVLPARSISSMSISISTSGISNSIGGSSSSSRRQRSHLYDTNYGLKERTRAGLRPMSSKEC